MPGIPIASGSGTLVAGTGMDTQPGTILLYIDPGLTIKQVLLYWDGQSDADGPAPAEIVPSS